MISNPVITAMVVNVILSVGVPIAAIVFFSRKVKMNLSSIFLGIILYVGFSTILLNLFDTIVMGMLSTAVTEWLVAEPIRYALYYAFIHALFMTAGYYSICYMGIRSDLGIGSGIGIGLGCGFASAFMDTGMQMINYISAAAEINKVGVESYMAEASAENIGMLQESVDVLLATTIGDVSVRTAEMLLLYALVLSLGVVMYLAVTHRSSIAYVYVGMAILFLAYLPAALYNAGILGSTLLVEAFAFIVTAAAVVLAIVNAKKFAGNPLRY